MASTSYVFNRGLLNGREVDRVFLHCSASNVASHDDVQVIRSWHMGRGWKDVGYHYFIKSTGELQIGRRLSWTPAAQVGHNIGTIAICLSGLNSEDFNDTQFETLIKLCRDMNEQIPNLTFHGHNEVSDKACPVFDYRKVLGLDELGVFGAIEKESGSDELTDRISALERRIDVIERQALHFSKFE